MYIAVKFLASWDDIRTDTIHSSDSLNFLNVIDEIIVSKSQVRTCLLGACSMSISC